MGDREDTEALQPFHLDHCDAQDPRRECDCGLARIVRARVTLAGWSEGDRLPAVCRGFYDHPRSVESLPLRLARHLGVVTFDG